MVFLGFHWLKDDQSEFVIRALNKEEGETIDFFFFYLMKTKIGFDFITYNIYIYIYVSVY